MIATRISGDRIEDTLAEHKRRIVQTVPELMKAVGRLAAVSCATATVPFGLDDGARRKDEAAIMRDIHRVYATPDRVAKSFPDPSKGNLFLSAIANRQYGKAQAVVDSFSSAFRNVPIQPFDGGNAHEAARRKGIIPANQRPAMIVQTSRNLNAYIDKKIGHAGEAKGGWATCALILGGMRGIPQWITRHAGGLSPGNVIESYTNGIARVQMTNLVRYASDTISETDKIAAIRIGFERFIKGQLQAIVRGNARKN
jgi:hypothetical protein